jgi:hypothetical protein
LNKSATACAACGRALSCKMMGGFCRKCRRFYLKAGRRLCSKLIMLKFFIFKCFGLTLLSLQYLLYFKLLKLLFCFCNHRISINIIKQSYHIKSNILSGTFLPVLTNIFKETISEYRFVKKCGIRNKINDRALKFICTLLLHKLTYSSRPIHYTATILTYLLTYGAEPSLRSCQLCSHSRTSQHFMEPEGSLPCSQNPSTGPYSEPDRSNPSHFISLRSILI